MIRVRAVVLALVAVAAVAVVPSAQAGPILGQIPDTPGTKGYLSVCAKFQLTREWSCYLVHLRRVVLAYRDPARQLPDLDVVVEHSGGYLEANCHMLMHVIGRDYARVHHVTLQTLQRYLPVSNDPGCSAGFGMGLVMGLSSQITLGGAAGAKATCGRAPTRFRSYTCYHALGHAYMRYYHGYLSYGLHACHALGAQAPDCVQGAFHDYWLGLSGQDGARYTHGLPTTARRLCGRQHGIDVVACWFRYYLTIPPKRTPSTPARLEPLCRGLGGEQRFGCIASASLISNPDPVAQFRLCARLRAGDQLACLHGVGFQNVSASLPAQISFISRCRTIAGVARARCYTWVGTALGMITDGAFGRTGCSRLASPARRECVVGVKRMKLPLVTFS